MGFLPSGCWGFGFCGLSRVAFLLLITATGLSGKLVEARQPTIFWNEYLSFPGDDRNVSQRDLWVIFFPCHLEHLICPTIWYHTANHCFLSLSYIHLCMVYIRRRFILVKIYILVTHYLLQFWSNNFSSSDYQIVDTLLCFSCATYSKIQAFSTIYPVCSYL